MIMILHRVSKFSDRVVASKNRKRLFFKAVSVISLDKNGFFQSILQGFSVKFLGLQLSLKAPVFISLLLMGQSV